MNVTATSSGFKLTPGTQPTASKDQTLKWVSIIMGAGTPFLIYQEADAATGGFLSAQSHLQGIFTQMLDLITTLAEPILWGYAVLGFIQMITDQQRGWRKVKLVVYADLGVTLLPAIFSILHTVGTAIVHSLHAA